MNTFVTIERAPLFEINKLGEVRYKKTGTIRKHMVNSQGYPFVQCALTATRNTSFRKVYIHRALAEAFLEKEDPSYNVVMHLNDDTSDFSLSNLKWGTQKQNMEQSSRTGHYSRVKKEVTLISPEGETVYVKGLRTFCAEQGLDWGNMQRMVNKRVQTRNGRKRYTLSVKGWKLAE